MTAVQDPPAVPEDGGTTPVHPPAHPPRALQLVCAGLAALLIFAPLAARALGHRGHSIENRAQRELPGGSAGWKYFSDLGGYLSDHLPLRQRAVRGDAWIDQHVFGEDPAFGGGSTPRVITGDDGLLFLADAIDNACAPHAPPAETAANLARFAKIVADSGRDVLTMVAPDKSTVHPELLPADLPTKDCFTSYTDELWADMASSDIAGYVDLRAALTSESQKSRELLYLRKDSHWDSAGSLVAVHAAIDHFAPGLFDPSEIVYSGLGDYTGDLTGLQGNPRVDQAPKYSVVRPDVTSVSVDVIDTIEGGFNRHFVNSAPEGRLITGKTVMFLDSFGLAALPQIVPYFQDLTVMRLVDYEPTRYGDLIAGADRVWMMSVERSLSYRFSFEDGSKEFLDSLATRLATGTGG